MQMNEFDNQFRTKVIHNIAGVDEAGRGPLAGAVYAAAVILPYDFYMPEINDSKKLSTKKREKLFDIIVENALAYSIASVDERVIDEVNILKATHIAMNKAVDGLKIKPDFVIIDGNEVESMNKPHLCVTSGDAQSQSIAAASILAKVARDRYAINELAVKYPQYEFEKHKGYGTKRHIELLERYGVSDIHRRSFFKRKLAYILDKTQ